MNFQEKLKEEQIKFGCLFAFKWLVWIESIQNKIKNEEILEETKKKKFWNIQVDLMIERPKWLEDFENNCLNMYFIHEIILYLKEFPFPEQLEHFMFDLLNEMKREKKEIFSGRIEISSIQNYVSKKNLKFDQKIEYFKMLKKKEKLQEEDYIYSSRIISGCIRNIYIYRKLKDNANFPEEKEILKFIKLTLLFIEMIEDLKGQIEEKKEEILNFKLLENNNLNLVLLNPLIDELKNLRIELSEKQKKFKDFLKEFLKIYSFFNNMIKKIFESSGTTLELMNKTLFDQMLKTKRKNLKIEVKTIYSVNLG